MIRHAPGVVSYLIPYSSLFVLRACTKGLVGARCFRETRRGKGRRFGGVHHNRENGRLIRFEHVVVLSDDGTQKVHVDVALALSHFGQFTAVLRFSSPVTWSNPPLSSGRLVMNPTEPINNITSCFLAFPCHLRRSYVAHHCGDLMCACVDSSLMVP